MPKVSVIMSVYNCNNQDELIDSVQSIINQTFKDWEFIICNDGSTNNTKTLIEELAKKDSRIRTISYSENKGLAHALNECLKVARGEYIARQDADDISEPERFYKQVNYLDKNINIDIVGCISSVFNSNGTWGEFFVPENPTRKNFLWNSPFIHPSVMMRKSALLKVGGYRIAKETRRCEDYDLFFRMYSSHMIGHNIQEKLYNYRIVIGPKKYRPMKDRIEEAKVRYIGYKNLGLMPKGIIYTFKPILIGLIPWCIFKFIKKNQY